MISIVVFALVLMAGSFFAGAFFRRKFADTIPFSFLGIILFLYICGAFGFLKAGVYLILAGALALLILSVVRLTKEKRFGESIKSEFGLEGLFFILIYAVLVILNYGRLSWFTDELSHWMYCVKAMSWIDDFAANSMSQAIYPSYPPGITLFQYFFQKLHEIFEGTMLFSEWRPYVALQLFAVVLFFPCLRRIKYHKVVKPILFGVAMLIPLVMYPGIFFSSLLVDPIIGVMAGTGFVYLLMDDHRSVSDKTVFTSMLCAVLVLMKDAGMFFAVFIGITFILYILLGDRIKGIPGEKAWIIRRCGVAVIPLVASLCAKGSWNLILNRYQPPRSFSNPIQIGEYLRLFFTGGDTTYKQETVDQFKRAFVDSTGFQIHNGITISYLLLVAILLLATVALTILLARNEKKEGNFGKSKIIIVLGVMLSLQTLVYIFFLGAIYISYFSEYEATTLASYERYIRMVILSQAIGVFWAALYWLQTKKKLRIFAIIPVALVFVLCPIQATKNFVTRELVQTSVAQREPYRQIQEVAEREFKQEDRVFYLSDTVFEGLMIRFIVYPKLFAETCQNANEKILDTQWIRDHILDTCDYLIVDHIGEDTAGKFRGLISTQEELQGGKVYKINQQEGILVPAEPATAGTN